MTSHFARQLLIFALVLPARVFSQTIELNATAESLMVQGSWEEARRAYLKLHASLEKTLGTEDPRTVRALANACDASVPLAAHLNLHPNLHTRSKTQGKADAGFTRNRQNHQRSSPVVRR